MLNKDKGKLKKIGKISLVCLLIRLLVYLLPGEFSGLIYDVLWVVPCFFLLALLFYGFEYILDRLLSIKENESED